MPTLMPAQYHEGYVALSFLISAIGAFVGLTAVVRMRTQDAKARRLNLLAAAVALGGIGIWSMHFVGMLSLRLNMGVSYSVPETVASLVAAVAAAALALHWVSRDRSFARLLGAGLALGAAVCVMHYLGMYGMRFNGFFQWSQELVGVSVLIALAAATAGLWLAFAVRSLGARIAASAVIAVAVCSMHYTGMAAASFLCTSPNPAAFPVGAALVTSLQLPVLVTTISLGMAMVIAIDQLFQRLAHRPSPALAAAVAGTRTRR